MPGASRLGDTTNGHGGFPPMPVITGSPTVLINGIPSARVGDTLTGHSNGHSYHGATIAQGAPNVLINGMPCARMSDATSCGDTLAKGSANVLVGG